MNKNTLAPLLTLGLPLLLAACGQSPTAGTPDPYANGVSYPWSYAASEGKLAAQRLTPGDNNLYFEPLLAASNNWGPIELNRSNGERDAGDGKTISLNGKTYDKGFGTHANSEMRFSLKGTNNAQCTRFTADIGVDDEVGNRGSVVFQVYLDGVKAYDSGTMTGASTTKRVDLDVSGKHELRLVVTDAGNGINYDHADWARPMIFCDRGDDTRYRMTMADASARIDGVVTTELTVVAEDPNDPGPVSFKLSIFSTPFIELVEPDRLYTAATLPARFQVRVRLRRNPDAPEPTGQTTRVVAHYEGYADPDFSRRFLFTLNLIP